MNLQNLLRTTSICALAAMVFVPQISEPYSSSYWLSAVLSVAVPVNSFSVPSTGSNLP